MGIPTQILFSFLFCYNFLFLSCLAQYALFGSCAIKNNQPTNRTAKSTCVTEDWTRHFSSTNLRELNVGKNKYMIFQWQISVHKLTISKKDKWYTSHRLWNTFQHETYSTALELSECLHIEFYVDAFFRFLYIHKELYHCNS